MIGVAGLMCADGYIEMALAAAVEDFGGRFWRQPKIEGEGFGGRDDVSGLGLSET